jgi:hypothetical protein
VNARRRRRWGRAVALALAHLHFASAARAQQADDPVVRSPAGLLALDQTARDVAADSLVLLVASHPDDRYVLPAVWLRSLGLRVAVLLATRGGGGQNSSGPETGDELERLRTLEAEAGCARFDGEVWYLDRPDGGFRRTAHETFAEWGREDTTRDLARLVRRIRPDAVITTHHAEEQHGHDLALVELLPPALALAADAAFACADPPHTVRTVLFGATAATTPRTLAIDVERLDGRFGVTLRRHAYDILRSAHRSPGPPAPLDAVFEPVMRLEPAEGTDVDATAERPLRLPSLFDADRWPGDAARAPSIAAAIDALPRRVARGEPVFADVAALVAELRTLRESLEFNGGAWDAAHRLDRRLAALEQLLLLLAGVQVELELEPGAIAVGGEDFEARIGVHTNAPRPVRWRAEGVNGVEATVQRERDDEDPDAMTRARATVVLRVPRSAASTEALSARFRGDRYEPPVQLRVEVTIDGVVIPITLAVPVELRPAVELHVVPRMLLLPSARTELQFSVAIVRNSRAPVIGELEVRGAAGYAIAQERLAVALREQRTDTFGFTVAAPSTRKPGVDVLRIRLGANRVELPVHKVDVRTAPGLRVGLVRSRDDTLPSVLGAGGLGVEWSELSDTDIAVAELTRFDSIVVDIRALRDRPAARASFRRLLDFALRKGKRLVVFYQKNVEFHPPGEGFVGAPFAPFQIGTRRVTRADAPVEVLLPRHVLLTHPNVIQPGDWDGWEQERALYLPNAYANEFEELLEVHDPGQPAERSALLYARTRDGEFVYCALALWRQLKKLHPGAVRLLANLVSPAPRD